MIGREELIKAIKEAKPDEIDTARRAFHDKRVKVSVRFNLEKPKEGSSNTLGKKDLDNMLKLVLDSLQTKADSQGKLDGLGLIQDDDCIYRLEANKKLVDRPEQAGISIGISEY
ncbi:MAG: RusA family crossover junction endodeoxyribonuclease [Nitrososphaerota archaeon]|jgi:Holliday junction resolvase RusA-like endonuclease|nr:RusA family crossover junction endodeoxyribonuclease [Nitrososphaerota archaeon]